MRADSPTMAIHTAANPIPLKRANLAKIGQSAAIPTYDRQTLSPGIVHIGLGNFHRAHQAWYLHRLYQQGITQDWAIIGAGVRPYDAAMRETLRRQDYLSTLLRLDPGAIEAEIIGSIIDYLPVEADHGALIRRLVAPAIRIVSLTVTEGGYYLNPATRRFDTEHPDIQQDAQRPRRPQTVFGILVAALKLRRQHGAGPLTGLCCDNLQGNGHLLRQAVLSLARLSDPELADWIAGECTFPNTMVDCIVPATGPRELALAGALGIDDAAPVTHEPFRQWVIEDRFCRGRPAWDQAGATFCDDVHAYETMKLRILNGGHQLIADTAQLLGITTIADAMRHPKINALYRKVETEEIAPHVRAVPEFTPAQYIELIAQRFANPALGDTTRRVAFDGSSRHPAFVIPSIRDGLAHGAPVTGLALVSAIWARYCLGTREDGSRIAPNDPHWDTLTAHAHIARNTPRAWLTLRRHYSDLADAPRFAGAFAHWLKKLYADGLHATLDHYLDQPADSR